MFRLSLLFRKSLLSDCSGIYPFVSKVTLIIVTDTDLVPQVGNKPAVYGKCLDFSLFIARQLDVQSYCLFMFALNQIYLNGILIPIILV